MGRDISHDSVSVLCLWDLISEAAFQAQMEIFCVSPLGPIFSDATAMQHDYRKYLQVSSGYTALQTQT
jgi:hypothetical protein